MLNRKVLPAVLVILFAGMLWAFQSQGGNGQPLTTQQRLLTTLGIIIEQNHYDPKSIDDNFSKEVFKRYLTAIDPDKNLFLQADINGLKKYEATVDDEVHGGEIKFVPAVSAIYLQRTQEAANLYKDLLQKPFDFTLNEDIVTDPDKLDFPATEAQRKDRWRKKLKYLTLERYADLLEQREKNKGTKDFVVKSNTQLEKEAREKVVKLMDKTFDRLKLKFTDDERFNLYLNTITTFMDPHSDYFPPLEKRSFEEQMSGRFYGIGALLKEEDGNVKIASLVTGSPAWKSGKIQVNDIIVKVGQGKQEPVDLTGQSVRDAVEIIRGSKGTEVRLTLKKPDGSLVVVPIIRDEIVTEDTYVKSAVINGPQKIGYIYLPEFYADYEKADGHRCSQDVAKELQKLKAEGVEGIVMDLRSNPGGYLPEVVQMVGLFIPQGPVVQVKDRDGKPKVLYDEDPSVLYSGPLTVLINEFSASASEIFAAAIQDYNRGVVLGSSSSFGKGTVQRYYPFGKPLDLMSGRTEFGAVKYTIQKYYRINGGSTQLKGVMPDIVVPDEYEYLKLREKDNENALPWDEIQKTNYSKWKPSFDMDIVKQKGSERIKNNVNFSLINNNAKWLAKQNDNVYSLNLDKYREEQKAIRNTVKQNDSLAKLESELPIEGLKIDLAKIGKDDKDKTERFNSWLKFRKSDIYIKEATNVIADMLGKSSNLALQEN